MNLTEKTFWALLKGKLPGDVSRVENSTDDGMPDLNATYILDYWVELKVCHNETKLRDVNKLLRDSQIVWNIRRGKQGALIFVLVRYEDFIVLYRWIYEDFNGILDNINKAYKLIALIRKKNGFDWEYLSQSIKTQITERIQNGLCRAGANR